MPRSRRVRWGTSATATWLEGRRPLTTNVVVRPGEGGVVRRALAAPATAGIHALTSTMAKTDTQILLAARTGRTLGTALRSGNSPRWRFSTSHADRPPGVERGGLRPVRRGCRHARRRCARDSGLGVAVVLTLSTIIGSGSQASRAERPRLAQVDVGHQRGQVILDAQSSALID